MEYRSAFSEASDRSREAEIQSYVDTLRAKGLTKEQLEAITTTSTNDDEIDAAFALIDEMNNARRFEHDDFRNFQ